MTRFFNKRQRRILFIKSNGKCSKCSAWLSDDFHADHIKPFSEGGKTKLINGQALCSKCNTQKSNKIEVKNMYFNGTKKISVKPRQWQIDCQDQAYQWLTQNKIHKQFVMNVAPGAGKTVAACLIAKKLFENNKVDRLIVIAPQAGVTVQWTEEVKKILSQNLVS